MFYQIFLSPNVKQSAVISSEHGIYELPHELTLDLRKLGNITRIFKLIELQPRAQPYSQNKKFCQYYKKTAEK